MQNEQNSNPKEEAEKHREERLKETGQVTLDQNEQKKKSDSSATKDAEQLKGKKLPQYKQVQQVQLGKLNQKKSIYRNL